MATIDELSDQYANFMVTPGPAGSGFCDVCWTTIDPGYRQCYPCSQTPEHIRVVLPITYSVDREQMHVALRSYKDGWGGDERDSTRNRFTVQLGAVLSRFLSAHEACLAAAAGVTSFDVVTIVPPRDADRWRLDWIVRVGCTVTAGRYEQLLRATGTPADKSYDPSRYSAVRALRGEAVLLIDDTWTQGRTAQSAGAALEAAGATVAAVVIGRHLNPMWKPIRDSKVTNADLLKNQVPFSWERCALCGGS
jgi:hypothetical protein